MPIVKNGFQILNLHPKKRRIKKLKIHFLEDAYLPKFYL